MSQKFHLDGWLQSHSNITSENELLGLKRNTPQYSTLFCSCLFCSRCAGFLHWVTQMLGMPLQRRRVSIWPKCWIVAPASLLGLTYPLALLLPDLQCALKCVQNSLPHHSPNPCTYGLLPVWTLLYLSMLVRRPDLVSMGRHTLMCKPALL